MDWNIAQAKQQFSELVRQSADAPQPIYRRDVAVAALVSAAEYEEFKGWRAAQQVPPLGAQFDELRAALDEAGLAGLRLPPRQGAERPGALAA